MKLAVSQFASSDHGCFAEYLARIGSRSSAQANVLVYVLLASEGGSVVTICK